MNNVSIIAAILIGGCLIFACGCQDTSDKEMRTAVTSGDRPGYVTYSLEFGREEWSCFGWADKENARQMDTRTVFRICSMTKSFVGALAAVLADRGAIDLDDPISRSFPEFTEEKKYITLRQCLSMTAGFAEMSPTMLKMEYFRFSTSDKMRICWMAISLSFLRRCGCGTPSFIMTALIFSMLEMQIS